MLDAAARAGDAPALPPLQRAIDALGSQGRAGAEALVALLERVEILREIPQAAAAVACFDDGCGLRAIVALAAACGHDATLLPQLYRGSRSPTVRDSICEAAGRVEGARPELFELMVAHLQENSFVASLSLAERGDSAALPHLQRRLRQEVRHGAGDAARQDRRLRALRIDGLVESIESLGGQVEPDLEAAVAKASAHGRAGLAPLLALHDPSPRN